MSEQVTLQCFQMVIAGFKGVAGIIRYLIVFGDLAEFCQKISCSIMLIFSDLNLSFGFFESAFQNHGEEIHLFFDEMLQKFFTKASIQIIDGEKKFLVFPIVCP